MGNRWLRRSSLAIVVLLLVALALACSRSGGVPKVDWTVEISGAVSRPLTLSYADLTKREQVKLENVLMQKSQGEDTTNTWEGPAVDALLQEAGVSSKATGVTAMAADGYAIQMTLADLQGGIIALKVDGTWIADDKDHGPIRLVVPGKPANHWLFQLTDIVVEESAIASPTPRPPKETETPMPPTATPVPKPTDTPAPAAVGGVEIAVNGKVSSELKLTLADLKALGAVKIQAPHPKSGEVGAYEGVLLSVIMEKAGAAADATTLVATASDGFSAEIPYADLTGCKDCIISFNDKGEVQLVMPGMASKAWVKGIAQLTLK